MSSGLNDQSKGNMTEGNAHLDVHFVQVVERDLGQVSDNCRG